MNRECDKKDVSGAMRLMEALSGVDEELLKRCGRDVKGRKSGWYMKTWAAVFCLAAVGAASWGGYMLTDIVNDKDRTGSSGYSAVQLKDADIISEADGGQEMAAAVPEEGMTEEKMPSGMESEKEQHMDMIENSSDNAGKIDNAAQDTGRGSGSSEEGIAVKESVQDEDFENREGMLSDVTVCPARNSKELTEEEARNTEVLGSCIPTVLPRGYVFESAHSYPDEQEAGLGICWTRGMDSIMLSLSVPENVPVTVDVAKPETYDERLYEIPFAETVPQEYRESVNDPVFAWEDMSLEIVRSRIIAREDRGDTSTPRGNFSVLFSDGVLLRFNGRGTAEEIWELLCSCGSRD